MPGNVDPLHDAAGLAAGGLGLFQRAIDFPGEIRNVEIADEVLVVAELNFFER